MTVAQVIYEDGLPAPRRYWAILAMSLALMMAVLDSTIANIALPTIAQELNATPANSIWIVNAYQIAVLISLLPLASLGEIIGFRRISQAGLVLFTAASLGCALAPSLPVLSLLRVIQGLGAAGIMSVNGALLRFTYPNRQFGRAVGITIMVSATSSAIGPTIASAILSVASWRWLFGVNAPIGCVALLIASLNLPYNSLQPRRLNWSGATMYAATLGLLVSGLHAFSDTASYGLGALQIAAAVIFGVLLVRREADRTSPLIPVDLLRMRIFSLSLLTSICSFCAQMLALVSLPFDLQHRLGYNPVETGLLMTPWPLAVAVTAPIAGRLADRWPAAVLGGIGLTILSIGLGLLALVAPDAGPAQFIWRMAICGVGFGLFQSPNNRILLGVAPRVRAGAAGGMLGTARLVGQSFGAVGVALCFHFRPSEPTLSSLAAAATAAALASIVSFSRLSAPQPAVAMKNPLKRMAEAEAEIADVDLTPPTIPNAVQRGWETNRVKLTAAPPPTQLFVLF